MTFSDGSIINIKFEQCSLISKKKFIFNFDLQTNFYFLIIKLLNDTLDNVHDGLQCIELSLNGIALR